MQNSHKSIAFVFVHGILGFDSIGLPSISLNYFRGLNKVLRKMGVDAYFPSLPAVGRVEQRANHLADYLSNISATHIVLIAHSMGGLDCRFYINQLSNDDRVKQLTTIATPHRGTPLVDWIAENANPIAWLARKITSPGIFDLSPRACKAFNERNTNRDNVYYESYAGHRNVIEMPHLYRPWTKMLDELDGHNDSQVPVDSAKWGHFCGVLRADHLELVGWSLGLRRNAFVRPFNHVSLYKHIIKDAQHRLR